MKNDVNVPSKSNKKKNFKKISFLFASLRSMTKIAGSGFISQRHRFADPDPDPHQNVMDPEHCCILVYKSLFRREVALITMTEGCGVEL